MQDMTHAGANSEIDQKYLTYMLGEEEYGIPVAQVVEIVKLENLIEVPHALQYFKGLMDIRGRVLPIVDLKTKLGLDSEFDAHDGERAIIIELNGRRVGLAVDEVHHVDRFPPENIDPGPPSIKNASSRYVTGVGKSKDDFVVLLNLQFLFEEKELEYLFVPGE